MHSWSVLYNNHRPRERGARWKWANASGRHVDLFREGSDGEEPGSNWKINLYSLQKFSALYPRRLAPPANQKSEQNGGRYQVEMLRKQFTAFCLFFTRNFFLLYFFFFGNGCCGLGERPENLCVQKVTDSGWVSLGAPSFAAVLPRVATSRAGGEKFFSLKCCHGRRRTLCGVHSR